MKLIPKDKIDLSDKIAYVKATVMYEGKKKSTKSDKAIRDILTRKRTVEEVKEDILKYHKVNVKE